MPGQRQLVEELEPAPDGQRGHVMDSVSGDGIGTDVLRYGQRVSVLALPAPSVFLSEKGLQNVGPRAFGFDLDFRSVFES